jgi:hypothetical protein
VPRAASPRRGVTLAEKASCALSEGITLPSSLLPAHAPDPCPPSVSGVPRRLVFAGCYQPPLRKGPSRRYLCESFPACLDPYPGGSCGASARFFPQDNGLPGMRTRSAPDDPHTATSVWNVISGLQSFAYVQAHQFARHPGCSYRSAFAPGSRGFYIRAYHGSLPPRAADMLTVRFGQLTVRGFSPLQIRSLVGCSSHVTLAQTGPALITVFISNSLALTLLSSLTPCPFATNERITALRRIAISPSMRRCRGASHATVAGHARPIGYDWSNSRFPFARESDGKIAGMAFATPCLAIRPNALRLLSYSSKSTGCPEGEAASP